MKDRIDDCSYYTPTKQYCSHSNVLSVLCIPCSLDFVHGTVTAVNETNLTLTCDDDYEPEQIHMQCFENGTVVYDDVCAAKYSYPLNITDIRGAGSRIDIMVKGEWGSICSDGFGSNEATVICKMFGLNYRSYSYWYGSRHIFIDNLKCNGSESHINECNYTVLNSCTSVYRARVYCTAYPLNITDIRLNSTISSRQGRVEVKVGGEWGTVCEDGFGRTDALVVCRMLGFNISYSNVLYLGTAYFGPGSGQIFVDELACSGDEYHLNECYYIPEHNCGHYDDVSVICSEHPFNIRLNSTVSSRQGRVEVEVGGEWGTVCDHGFGLTDALVVCRMLGFNVSYSNILYFGNAYFGQGNGAILFRHLSCNGDEFHLSECNYFPPDYCGHHDDVSVICFGKLL
ncbi:deleted in malignant brain tumors 1 protein-like [Mercenaria mercenaria]|uniref:deleted in malignant brain tumors 1 protein-like n=1 Tax=Mercenaria mercenaria TaxID=6596 RepID=UPI00234E96B7|nr:deleted in malignant brain tumors 1 protein-like [Mercenaria mercenaria]